MKSLHKIFKICQEAFVPLRLKTQTGSSKPTKQMLPPTPCNCRSRRHQRSRRQCRRRRRRVKSRSSRSPAKFRRRPSQPNRPRSLHPERHHNPVTATVGDSPLPVGGCASLGPSSSSKAAVVTASTKAGWPDTCTAGPIKRRYGWIFLKVK